MSAETEAGDVDSGNEMSSSSDISPPARTPHEIPSSSASMPVSMPCGQGTVGVSILFWQSLCQGLGSTIRAFVTPVSSGSQRALHWRLL